jgi:hypothetical protein
LVDGRWRREVQYKHKLTSLTTSFTTALLYSMKLKKYACPDFCRSLITLNAPEEFLHKLSETISGKLIYMLVVLTRVMT